MPVRLPPVLDLAPLAPPVVVVGDVHLAPDEPATAARFVAFLDGLPGRCATLVVLGDLFDAWWGRGQARDPFYGGVLERLRRVAAAGVRVAFLPGNRDYALASERALGLEAWPDVVRTTWGGRRVVLTHGDLLCSADLGYQRLRAFLRGPVGRAGLACFPRALRAWIARGLRGVSRRAARRKPWSETGIDYGLARAWLDGYDAEVLVAGHVHTGVHHRLADGRVRDVLVLKDWGPAAGVVRWDGATIALAPP